MRTHGRQKPFDPAIALGPQRVLHLDRTRVREDPRTELKDFSDNAIVDRYIYFFLLVL